MGHADPTIGVSDIAYIIAMLMAFVLILMGGLVWIRVAMATPKH